MSDVDTTREHWENYDIQRIDLSWTTVQNLIGQARTQAFDDLLEAMAKKRPILENVSDSINDYSLGHNAAITKVTDIVHQLKSSKKGADDE